MANPTPYSDAIWEAARGEVKLKCVKVGGYTMTNYGAYMWAQDEERSLFDGALPVALRADEYGTARNMIVDPARELTQRIAAGDFIIVEDRHPNPSALVEAMR